LREGNSRLSFLAGGYSFQVFAHVASKFHVQLVAM